MYIYKSYGDVEIRKIDRTYEVWSCEKLINTYKTKRSALKMFQTEKFRLKKEKVV